MHRNAANKQILKVAVVITVVIILVTILFSISPREEAVAGRAAVAGAPGPTCSGATPLRVTSNVNYPAKNNQLGSSTGSFSGCCPTGSTCVMALSTIVSCYSDGDLLGVDFLCSSSNWITCDNTVDGIVYKNKICQKVNVGLYGWESDICTRPQPILGQIYGTKAYCDAQGKWSNSCIEGRKSIVKNPDGSPRTTFGDPNEQNPTQPVSTNSVCCPQDTCVAPPANYCIDQGIYANYICTNGENTYCSQLYQGSVKRFGRDNYICMQASYVQGGQPKTGYLWKADNDGCGPSNEGQIVNGKVYCKKDGNVHKWVLCGSDPAVQCLGSGVAATLETCNSAKDGQLLASGSTVDATYYCSARASLGGGNKDQWVKCDARNLGAGVDNGNNPSWYNNNYVCSSSAPVGGTPTYTWKPIPSCSTCAGSRAGECLGSNVRKIDTGLVSSLYSSEVSSVNDPFRQISCSPAGGCIYNQDDNIATPNFWAFDDLIQSRDLLVCGSNNNLLECLGNPLTGNYIASDGKRWLCEPGGVWNECSATVPASISGNTNMPAVSKLGEQKGDYRCQLNSVGKPEWFSQFACSGAEKYRLRNYGTISNGQICDGTNYISCSQVTPTTFTDKIKVSVVCDAQGSFTVTELACSNNLDDDNDGKADCQDSDCTGPVNVAVHENANYMVRLKDNECSGRTYNLHTAVDNTGAPTGPLSYSALDICDNDLSVLRDTVEICSSSPQPSPVPGQVPPISIPGQPSPVLAVGSSQRFTLNEMALQTNAAQPTEVNRNSQVPVPNRNIGFTYFRNITGKNVKVGLQWILDNNNNANFNLQNFSRNMLDGQQVILQSNNEYYLLTYPQSERTFQLVNVTLTHLLSSRILTSALYQGTNSYVHTYKPTGQSAGETIIVKLERGAIVVSAGRPGEAPAGLVLPGNVERDYEVSVSLRNPTRITGARSNQVNVFSLCRQDVAADIDQALFCVDNDLKLALKKNNLTYYQLNNDEYGLLYDFNGTNKVISITKLENLDINTPTSANPRNVIYANYINNLVSGRRLAVRYANKLYLISHPVRPTFSQAVTKLTSFIEGVTTNFNALGSEGLVDYNILDGKVTIKRRYGQVPPLPFQMSVLSSRQILDQPINLLQELSASMTSELPISISGPVNYGILNKSVNDRIQLQAQFRLHQDVLLPTGQDFTLSFNTPTIQTGAVRPVGSNQVGSNQVLLHYNNAQSLGSGISARLVKTVALYLLYDVTGQGGTTTSHSFDSTFLSSFTAGKEIAIKYGNSYYLLSYQGATANTAQFFTLDRLVLSTLDKSRTFQPSVSGLAATFTVAEGQLRVNLVLDPRAARANDLITFSGGVGALTPRLFGADEYMVPLTSTGLVSISDPTVGIPFVTLDICQENRYAGQTAARICTITSRRVGALVISDFEVNQPTLFAFDIDNNPATDNTEHFILETNGLTDASKQVFIRRVINLDNVRPPVLANFVSYRIMDWNLFARNVSVGFGPVFNISGMMYSPEAQSQDILSFAFRDYPSASVRYPIRQQNQMTPILYNVSYTLGKDLVIIKQGEDRSRGVRATVTDALVILEPYKYLKDDKSVLLLNATGNDLREYFVTDLPSPIYHIGVSSRPTTSRANVVRIRLADDKGRTYENRYFAAGDSKDVRLGTGFATISVPVIVYNNAGNFVHAHVTMKRK